MRTLTLTILLLAIPLIAAERPRAFPLWDGKETVEAYATRVNLPAAKSIDLGGGVMLELVLIPAGEFVMETPEPLTPAATARNSQTLLALGIALAEILIAVLLFEKRPPRARSFMFRWLFLFAGACGLTITGGLRWHLALEEHARHAAEFATYKALLANEKPAHEVTLARPFYMGKYTVTQAQYRNVMGDKPSWFSGARLPVENVFWNEAADFCAKLNDKLRAQLDESTAFMLPTEAQWEYSCRAGTTAAFYTGRTLSTDEANFNGRILSPFLRELGQFHGKTMPVGSFSSNAFGLCDMHGNVGQWCKDWFAPDYYRRLADEDPQGPESGDRHVWRGGSWASPAISCRSAQRGIAGRDYHTEEVGFRIVLTVPPGK